MKTMMHPDLRQEKGQEFVCHWQVDIQYIYWDSVLVGWIPFMELQDFKPGTTEDIKYGLFGGGFFLYRNKRHRGKKHAKKHLYNEITEEKQRDTLRHSERLFVFWGVLFWHFSRNRVEEFSLFLETYMAFGIP